jgi:hypothetical protein
MKKLLVVVAIAVIGVGAWRVRSHAQRDGREVLVDRVWIDHLPASDRDPLNFFALFSEQKFGVFQNMTAYRGSYEVFRPGRGGWTYPQTGETDRPQVRVYRCNENGMDYCLDISGNSRGVHRYYSRKDWVIKSLADEQAFAAKLLK